MSKQLLGNLDQGLLFIVSAPAGTGKSTLIEMLCEEYPTVVGESCSYTTRKPRPGEVEGHHYHFISVEEFERKIKGGDFLEHATVFGNYYGTDKKEVKKLQNQGKHIFLVIDTQGAIQIQHQIEACFIFITPPSMEELKRRLYKRKTETEEKMEERLAWAEEEIKVAKLYDYHIVNDNLEITYEILKSIVVAEEHRTRGKNNEK